MRLSAIVGALSGALLSIVAAAESTWFADDEVQRRLAHGEVVVRTALADQARGRVYAAVKINARAETIWTVMTDCEQAPSFVPGLKKCRRVASAPDGSWEILEHEVKYSWLLPTVHYVFRADYQRPRRVDFQRISGDLKEQEGAWVLEETSDGSATIVGYEVYLDPGFWVPKGLVRQVLRRDLPAVLGALRARVENADRLHGTGRTEPPQTDIEIGLPCHRARNNVTLGKLLRMPRTRGVGHRLPDGRIQRRC